MRRVRAFVLVAVMLVVAAALGLTACSENGSSSGGASPATDRAEHSSAPSTPQDAPRNDTGEIVDDGERHVDMGGDRPIRGTVVMRAHAKFGALNPALATSADAKIVKYHLNPYLLTEHPEEVELMPWLAASLPEVSDDGLVHTWTLKDGATWSDGRPVTAADAVFTWSMLSHEDPGLSTAAAPIRGNLGAVKSVEAAGERTFRVTYSSEDVRAVASFGLGFGIVPKHASPSDPDEFRKARDLPTCGPYSVKSRAAGELVLERREPWWGDEHAAFKNRWRVKTFIYKLVPDEQQAVQQLESGDLDIAAVDVETYVSFRKSWPAGLTGAHYYLPQWSFIGWNCKVPRLADVRVRRALSYLVPRGAINRRYYDGLARAVSGPFFPDSVYYDRNIEPMEYDTAEAVRLLGEAGWKDRDGDGRLDKDGKPFELVLLMPSVSEPWAGGPLAQYRDILAQVGITLKLDVLEEREVYARCAQDDFEAYVVVWGVEAILPEVRSFLHSSQTRPGGYNWQNYANPELDELIDGFHSSRDDVRRISLARKIHRRLHQDQPVAFLFNNPSCVVWNERLKGVHTYPLGIRQWDFRVEDDDQHK